MKEKNESAVSRSVGRKAKTVFHKASGRININKTFTRIKNRFFLPSFLKEMQSLKIGGISGGNRIKLLIDGDVCFAEFIKAIKSAKTSVNLETYIFKSDDVGWMMAELLVKKAAEGVRVNVIYDAVGCIGTSPALFNYMKKEGVELLEFHPVAPWKRYWNLSMRDHRKLLVVDGRIAFVGGINIGMEYAGKKFNGGRWRDTHLRIEGPAVRDIQVYFMEIWIRYGGNFEDYDRHFPLIKEAGRKLLMVLGSRSRKKIKPVQESYISAIKFAKESIYITNAYFIPDAKFYRAFVRAAKRGVDVRFLLPGKSDLPFVQRASRYLYKKYLKSGIRVYEYTPYVLHAKTAVIDGIWSTVGSSNIDRRSFSRNLEINAVVLDQKFGAQMEGVFFSDLRKSVELKLENWQKRSLFHFIGEWFFYRFRNLF